MNKSFKRYAGIKWRDTSVKKYDGESCDFCTWLYAQKVDLIIDTIGLDKAKVFIKTKRLEIDYE